MSRSSVISLFYYHCRTKDGRQSASVLPSNVRPSVSDSAMRLVTLLRQRFNFVNCKVQLSISNRVLREVIASCNFLSLLAERSENMVLSERTLVGNGDTHTRGVGLSVRSQ